MGRWALIIVGQFHIFGSTIGFQQKNLAGKSVSQNGRIVKGTPPFLAPEATLLLVDCS